MATFFGPKYIEPPPAPMRPYGLFDVALGPMPFPAEEAVGGGIQYIPDTCSDAVYLYDMTCPPVSGSKTFDALDTAISGGPFAVITSFLCGSVGITEAEVRQRLLLRMQLHEQRAVERRVWQGQTLAQGQGAITGLFRGATSLGTADCATEAVSLLEQALASNGIVGGLIHARPRMAAYLEQAHQIQYATQRRLQTCLGTQYVFGQGYDGSGPAGEAADADSEWMYASGRVLVWQDSEIQVPSLDQVFRRSSNERIAVAERVYLALVECGVWAVEVTRTCATTGATS